MSVAWAWEVKASAKTMTVARLKKRVFDALLPNFLRETNPATEKAAMIPRATYNEGIFDELVPPTGLALTWNGSRIEDLGLTNVLMGLTSSPRGVKDDAFRMGTVLGSTLEASPLAAKDMYIARTKMEITTVLAASLLMFSFS